MGLFGASKLEKKVDHEIAVQMENLVAAMREPDSEIPVEFGASVTDSCKYFRDKIVKECRTSLQSNEWVNHPLTDLHFGVFMMVSTIPWTTQETIEKLRRMFPANGVSYMGLRKSLIFEKWPSEDYKYYFHLLLCLGSDKIESHSAFGDYNGSKRHELFEVTPEGLESEEERERARITELQIKP